MTREEFKALKPGSRFKHLALPRAVFIVESIETDYDFSTKPASKFTDAIITTDGRRMKINDPDVVLCSLVGNPT